MFEDEEKKRKVMGLSARAKCIALWEIVSSCGPEQPTTIQTVCDKLQSDWNVDTMKRYIAVARKLNSDTDLMNELMKMEFQHGRDAALDGITSLRSLTGLNLEPQDNAYVVPHPMGMAVQFKNPFTVYSCETSFLSITNLPRLMCLPKNSVVDSGSLDRWCH